MGRKKDSGSGTNSLSPLIITENVESHWKSITSNNEIKNNLLKLRTATYRDQMKLFSQLIKQFQTLTKNQKNYGKLVEEIYGIVEGIFVMIEHQIVENVTFFPVEFYRIIQNIVKLLPQHLKKKLFDKYYSKTHGENIEIGLFETQILDFLYLHEIFEELLVDKSEENWITLTEGVTINLEKIIEKSKNVKEIGTVEVSSEAQLIVHISLRILLSFSNQIKNQLKNIQKNYENHVGLIEKKEEKVLINWISGVYNLLYYDSYLQETLSNIGLLLNQFFNFFDFYPDFLFYQIIFFYFPNYLRFIQTRNKLENEFAYFLREETGGNIFEYLIARNTLGYHCLPFSDLLPAAKLSLFRGISIAIDIRILLLNKPLPSFPSSLLQENTGNKGDSKGEKVSEETEEEDVLLFDIIMPHFIHYCENIQVPIQKLLAFQAVKNIVIKLHQHTATSITSAFSQPSSSLSCEHSELTADPVEHTDDDTSIQTPPPSHSLTLNLLNISSLSFFDSFFVNLVHLFWSNWEYFYEPVQIQIEGAFEKLLEIVELINKSSNNDGEKENCNFYMNQLISDIIYSPWNKRGKYNILSLISQMFGSEYLFRFSPDLFNQLFLAFMEGQHKGRAGNLLKNILTNWSVTKTGKKGILIEAPVKRWVGYFVYYLLSPNAELRDNILTYALPIVLSVYKYNHLVLLINYFIHPPAFPSHLPPLSLPHCRSITGQVHLSEIQLINILSILKFARKLGVLSNQQFLDLLENKSNSIYFYSMNAETNEDGEQVESEWELKKIILASVVSGNHLIQLTAIECLSESKTASELLEIEEEGIKLFLDHSLKNTDNPKIRQECGNILQKVMIRIKSHYKKKLQNLYHIKTQHEEQNTEFLEYKIEKNKYLNFLREYSNKLGSGFYLGSPYCKLSVSIDLYKQLFIDPFYLNITHATKTHNPPPPSSNSQPTGYDEVKMKTIIGNNLFSKENLYNILGCMWDSYEKTRDSIFNLLLYFPSPFPFVQDLAEIRSLFIYSPFKLISRSRERDGDVGSLLIRLFYHKYLKNNGPLPNFAASIPSVADDSKLQENDANQTSNLILTDNNFSLINYENEEIFANENRKYIPLISENNSFRLFYELYYLLKFNYSLVQKDFIHKIDKNSIHGIINCIYYFIVDLQLSKIKDTNQIALWRILISQLVNLLYKILDSAMAYIADITTEGYDPNYENQDEEGGEGEDEGTINQGEVTTPALAPNTEKCNDNETEKVEEKYSLIGNNSGKHSIVCSWLIIKSISLFFGKLIQEAPLQSKIQKPYAEEKQAYVLTIEQVKEIANKIVKILLSTRHKGVLEKSYVSFEWICLKIFDSQILELLKLPGEWIEQLKDTIKNVHSTMITRRSAGIPYIFIAILRAEKRTNEFNNKHFIDTIQFLLHQISFSFTLEDKSFLQLNQQLQNSVKIEKNSEKNLEKNTEKSENSEDKELENEKKTIRVVHCFNVLRSLLKDKIVGSELDNWIGIYLIYTINGLNNESWAIRNVSSLSFSIIMNRIFGTARRNIEERSKLTNTTFSIFFSRIPFLFDFLLEKLKFLVENQSVKDKVHSETSLFSLLVLFSRLSPSESVLSTNNQENNEKNTEENFLPVILRCSGDKDLRIREMAARALIPLIHSSKLVNFIQTLIGSLPARSHLHSRSHNYIHGILLIIYYLIKENIRVILSNSSILSDFFTVILKKFMEKMYLLENDCLLISSAFLNILFLFLSDFIIGEDLYHSGFPEDSSPAPQVGQSKDSSRGSSTGFVGELMIGPDEEDLKTKISEFICKLTENVRNIFSFTNTEKIPWCSTFRSQLAETCCLLSLHFPEHYYRITNESVTSLFKSLIDDFNYDVRLKAIQLLNASLQSSTASNSKSNKKPPQKPTQSRSQEEKEAQEGSVGDFASEEKKEYYANVFQDEKSATQAGAAVVHQKKHINIQSLNNNDKQYAEKLEINHKKIQIKLIEKFNEEKSEEILKEIIETLMNMKIGIPYSLLQENSEHMNKLKNSFEKSSFFLQSQIIIYLGFLLSQMIKYSKKKLKNQKIYSKIAKLEETEEKPETHQENQFHSHFQFFTNILEKYTAPTEAPEYRFSCCQSICYSNIAKVSFHKDLRELGLPLHEIVKFWIYSIRLVEDDDDEIRNKILQHFSKSGLLRFSDVLNKYRINNVNFTFATVLGNPQAIESIFQFLYSQFPAVEFPEFKNYLISNLVGFFVDAPSPSWDILDKTLFTKEIDNFWEESLFIFHCSAFYLSKIFSSLPSPSSLPSSSSHSLSFSVFDCIFKKFNDLSQFYAATHANSPFINLFADQSVFIYSIRICLSLFSLSFYRFDELNGSDALLSLRSTFLGSLQSLSDLPISPLFAHSLYFLCGRFNFVFFQDDPIPNPFLPIAGISLYFSTSLV